MSLDCSRYLSRSPALRRCCAPAVALAAVAAAVPGIGQCGIYFLSSSNTNQVMIYDEYTGAFRGTVGTIINPAASQVGYDGDMFVPSDGATEGSGLMLRYDSVTGAYKGLFPLGGRMTTPVALGVGPDGLAYIDDAANNTVLRYDKDGNFIDVFCDGVSSPLSIPAMQVFDDKIMYIASGGNNSILKFDLKTKAYLGYFVPPGSGGLVKPIGLEFGPDGNLYTSSSGTNAVLRYNGKTGEFIDAFVPPGSGGLSFPRAIRFAGPNTNLFVASANTKQVLEYDRLTGHFIGVFSDASVDGVDGERGLAFSNRPTVLVTASVEGESRSRFREVHIDHSHIQDFVDPHPKVELTSIVSSDPNVDMTRAVRHARFGEADYDFELDFRNNTGVEQQYTITYKATNVQGEWKLGTTTVKVPPR